MNIDPRRRVFRAHLVLSAVYVGSRLLLDAAGLRFSFSLDWMWLADPIDLREHLAETLWYFHAFPPGINTLTGLLLKVGAAEAAAAAHLLFGALGLLLANLLFYLGRAIGLSHALGAAFAMAFSMTPAAIYFEHLYHYEWPVIVMLCASAALFHRAVAQPSAAAWRGFFFLCAIIGLSRSTFHLAWLVALAVIGVWLADRGMRRTVLAAAALPVVLLFSLYLKNAVLFGEFAGSTFGPASLTLVTVNHLPQDARDERIRNGQLSQYAAISVYAPPREYARFFSTPDHPAWPAQVTRLEHRGLDVPNFNHWWLLEVHRARKADVAYYLRERPLAYAANVALGLRDLFRPTTTWHPRDRTAVSPHHQHRQVLGGYERWFNRAVHSLPVAPVGLYALLPLLLAWACVHAWTLVRTSDRVVRARGALLMLSVFQLVYVAAASSMLTFLESARYRFQVEWAIWLIAAAWGAWWSDRVRDRRERERTELQRRHDPRRQPA